MPPVGNIKYGIIGFGVAGRIHAEALRTVHGAELIAICPNIYG